MKESIQLPGSEVAIVIYDAPLPPRYFRLNKKFLRTLFISVPIILTLVFAGLFLWGLGTRLEDAPAPSFPTEKTEEEKKIAELEGEINLLKNSNNKLAEKLSAKAPAIGTEDPYLMAIKRPYGMQNLISKNLVNADEFDFIQELNKVSLKFMIKSSTPEHRVTGHVLVFMVSPTGIMAYPGDANRVLAEGIKYSMGEPFAVARVRPTNAIFDHLPSGESVKFVVYIFSREGDLLMIKETQTYQTGIKK